MNQQQTNTNECPYCKGIGYFQLLLGGSETCSCCSGSGKENYSSYEFSK